MRILLIAFLIGYSHDILITLLRIKLCNIPLV